MSTDPRRERLDELLCDRALVGLSPQEERELAQLLAATGADEGELELVAGALDGALAPRAEPLPDALRQRLSTAARAFSAKASVTNPPPALPAAARRSPLAWAGWLVAAAACVLAFLLWRADVPADPARMRAVLLARADTLHPAWAAQDLAKGASGDVVWSQALQLGVMRFEGLAPNDPKQSQYQLWIFDETQEHPIDGGVFDVTGGDVLVRIDAKLRVQKPKLFAVTVEKPGGVVVSDQKRIALVAKL